MPPYIFYESSNGDVWSLIHDPDSGAASVMHQPNARSGGKASYIEVDQFLGESPSGPQHEALRGRVERMRAEARALYKGLGSFAAETLS